MGKVVEYAGKVGAPRWIKPAKKAWDYRIFGDGRQTPAPDEVIPMVFGKINGGAGGFNHWTVNGKQYEEQTEPRVLHKGKRYRLVFDNHTDDAHPVHLHRNSFELTKVHGVPTAGILKDVVLLKGYRQIEADFTPTGEGLTLFHCHQQLHMDYGFKMLFNVV
jgi:FtsP/CotA-like multicopper oxidase with cupredoxin domain